VILCRGLRLTRRDVGAETIVVVACGSICAKNELSTGGIWKSAKSTAPEMSSSNSQVGLVSGMPAAASSGSLGPVSMGRDEKTGI